MPFDPPPPGLSRSRWQSGGDWMRRRWETTREVVRHHPVRALANVAGFLVRWLLRVGLPIAGAAAMLHLFPYRATAGGVHFRVEGTMLTRAGLSADTTFGSWQFEHVDGLPVGAHISPENVDVVKLGAAAAQNGQSYVNGLRDKLADQIPSIVLWLTCEALLGLLLGLVAAAAANLALRYLRKTPRREREWLHRTRQLSAAVAVFAVLVGYGFVSYNPHWVRKSRVTGTLAALQLFPGQLSQYYVQRAKVFDVISAIAGIQSQLQRNIDQAGSMPTSYNIMFISDMHLAGSYPLVEQYAANFDVALIINTGDESEFGTQAEMTPSYLGQLRELTAKTPMIWMAGNHDSPATVSVMRSIPGITVLGTKTEQPDGGFAVSAQQVSAFGLTIAALADPRVYGAAGDFGSNDGNVVHALERKAADDAVRGVSPSQQFDIFASHESSALDQLAHNLDGQIRQTNAGHQHEQNGLGKVLHNGRIDLVEGSTGAGGLDNINRDIPAPPIEFSIESVAANCQFTKVVRFQLAGPPPTDTTPLSGQHVTASTLYLDRQKIGDGRTCTIDEPRSPVVDVGVSTGG